MGLAEHRLRSLAASGDVTLSESNACSHSSSLTALIVLVGEDCDLIVLERI